MSLDRPARPSRQPKRKQRAVAEPELSDTDDYGDFSEARQEPVAEFNTVIVGDETETDSAVQSIQQVLTLSAAKTKRMLPLYSKKGFERGWRRAETTTASCKNSFTLPKADGPSEVVINSGLKTPDHRQTSITQRKTDSTPDRNTHYWCQEVTKLWNYEQYEPQEAAVEMKLKAGMNREEKTNLITLSCKHTGRKVHLTEAEDNRNCCKWFQNPW